MGLLRPGKNPHDLIEFRCGVRPWHMWQTGGELLFAARSRHRIFGVYRINFFAHAREGIERRLYQKSRGRTVVSYRDIYGRNFTAGYRWFDADYDAGTGRLGLGIAVPM